MAKNQQLRVGCQNSCTIDSNSNVTGSGLILPQTIEIGVNVIVVQDDIVGTALAAVHGNGRNVDGMIPVVSSCRSIEGTTLNLYSLSNRGTVLEYQNSLAHCVEGAVVELAGLKDIRTKCLRSNNPRNVVSAVIEGLAGLNSASDVAERRGKSMQELLG